MQRRKPSSRLNPALVRPAALAVLLGSVIALSGCSSSSSTGKVQVGPIAFTDANGAQLGGTHTSMTAGATVYVDVALANDTAQLGIDWTVACGSAPPVGSPLPPGVPQDESCGIFTPVHTTSAPVPDYATSGAGIVTLFTAPPAPPKEGVVTLYAASTADHSRYSTVTLTILGLPISIAFAPVPPSSLPVNEATSLKAVLTNDYSAAGVKWTVSCGSSSCGSLSAAQTASGVATTYTAPAAVPAGGVVTVTATSVTDSTKSISANITIVPISVSILPATLNVAAGAAGQLAATVTNDASNAGVDWSLSCASSGTCGTITAHTASGSTATYTAPASPPTGGVVTVTAASTADPMAASTAAITVGSSSQVTGKVVSGHQPVNGASLSLYAASDDGSVSTLLNASEDASKLSGGDGSFTIAAEWGCPSPSSQLYVVARGGDAGEGTNPSLALMTALGSCGKLSSLGNITINEVTTVASVYALSGFMSDAEHVGATRDNSPILANAFALADNLVDPVSGEARSVTPGGNGQAAPATIHTLANILNSCTQSSGGVSGDGTACGQLFALTGGNTTGDTLQAALHIAQNAASGSLTSALYQLLGAERPFEPVEDTVPLDWRIALHFAGRGLNDPQSIFIDPTGNVWIFGSDGATELESTGVEAAGSPFSHATAPQSAGQPLLQAVDPAGNLWILDPKDNDSENNMVTEWIGGTMPRHPQ
jgi:hypothetical protein